MEKNSSIFDRNYDLFMERFPKMALLLSLSPQQPSSGCFAMAPLELSDIDILYFYGIGNGEGYFLVKNWLEQKSHRRLVFLSDDFSQFLQLEQAYEVLLNPQVVFESAEDIDALAERFPFARIEMVCLPSLKTKKFQSLRLRLLRKTTLSHALHLDRLHGYQPFANFVQNLKHLPHSFYANGLKGCFSGVPAIVCGAGPSLEKAIPHLKKIADKALLIAGGSTLAALSSQGVSPHFGMAIDPNLEEFRRLKNSFAFEVPFLYSTRVFPSVFQTCNGPFGYMRSGIGGLLELWIEEELGLADPLLGTHLSEESISVTTICLAWAEFLGCSPIILSGVDLAYTGKKHYAEGVDRGEKLELAADLKKNAPDKLIKKKDRMGRSIFTAVRWLMESASISHFAKMHPEVTFINTTEGGMEIAGIAYEPLEKVGELWKEKDLRAQVRQAIFLSKMPVGSEEIINRKLAELSASLDRVIAHLEVLAIKKSPLDEMDLADEIAYSYLFYDIESLLEKELDPVFPSWPSKDAALYSIEKWRRFLKLAKKYQLVFQYTQDDSKFGR